MCVTSVSYSVLLNGKHVDLIIPRHGLRQRCPLLPDLFILCTERLFVLIRKELESRNFHGGKICRRVPIISHLFFFFFAHDHFFFFWAIVEKARKMLSVF